MGFCDMVKSWLVFISSKAKVDSTLYTQVPSIMYTHLVPFWY